MKIFELLERFFLLRVFDQRNLVFLVLIFLLIFASSADFDGCKKLIKRGKKNINFFEIPEINLKFNCVINLEGFLGLFYWAFLLGHLLEIQIGIFQQRKRQ